MATGILTAQEIADLALEAQAATASNAALAVALPFDPAPTDFVTRQRSGSADLTNVPVTLVWPATVLQLDVPYGQKIDCILTAPAGTDITYGDTIIRTLALNFPTPLTGNTVFKVIGFEERAGAKAHISCELAGAA